MRNILTLSLIAFALTISGCSTPKPPTVSLTRDLKPVNFSDKIISSNNVIKSEQIQNHWDRQFPYPIDDNQKHSPEFFYAIAHADKIIVMIKPPFIDFVFSKVQLHLRNYGITAPLELHIAQENNKNSQVTLKCIKF